MHTLVENGSFVPILNYFWSRFSKWDRESGTKGPDPLVPGPMTRTKAFARGKKIFCTPRNRARDVSLRM